MKNDEPTVARKQVWDYFQLHASQRMTVFNFYIVLSSLIATGYISSSKSDSNLHSAQPALAALLCLFAFVFWKLDQRTKFLIKHAERALKYFERTDPVDKVARVFTQEELETNLRKVKGWHRIMFWKWQLSYSDCFNFVYFCFFTTGILGLIFSYRHG
jgi:hypothetical protein